MNWLHTLTQEILARREVSGDQRRALALWVTELSIICDKHVPEAPAPELEFAETVFKVNWILNDRFFAIGVTPGLRLLLTMNDPHGTKRDVDPTHQELKRYVLCLFEGWKAP